MKFRASRLIPWGALRAVRRLLLTVLSVAVLGLGGIALFVGFSCYGSYPRTQAPLGGAAGEIRGYQRPETPTLLTLPEWFVTFSADEYARFVAQRPPSGFPYLTSAIQYWSYYGSVCRATQMSYPFDIDAHIRLSVIGASYTAEQVLKGLYENTVGRLSSAAGANTEEDAFATQTAAEYAAFVHTVPWYQFQFGNVVRTLWNDVPRSGGNQLRKWERRAALTIEYGTKSGYAWLIGGALSSAYNAGDLAIHARIENASDEALGEKEVESVASDGPGVLVVRLPRYAAFTENVLGLLESGVRFLDIAGNDEILITIIAPADLQIEPLGAGKTIASHPIPTDATQKRVALLVPIARLHEIVPKLRGAGASVEHVYDY
jgi:hypothetical protein